MESLVQPDAVACAHSYVGRGGSKGWGNYRPRQETILEAILYRGELPRGRRRGRCRTGDRRRAASVSLLMEAPAYYRG